MNKMTISDRFWDFYFQKKKPDWALGAKEGEAGARPPSEGPPAEVEAWEDLDLAWPHQQCLALGQITFYTCSGQRIPISLRQIGFF